ncbi:PTS sugar transporter subunit IIA [Lawsonibacter sp. LCP25S3_G6]|uniref:PTS sugar transporter subunit IIA n=1 Tax=unclassified Lawsonibacter TaxID=2617946 RepID=UPI003F96C2D9
MSAKERKIILMTHGRVGEHMIEGLKMIVGITDEVYAVPLLPGMTVEEFMDQVSSLLEGQEDPSLLLVDMFGGTPSNCAGALSSKYPVEVISGVNIPMLIEAVQIRGMYSGEELRQHLVEAGVTGINDLSKIMSERQ